MKQDTRKWNGLAISGFILTLLWIGLCQVGLVLSIMALCNIDDKKEKGKGLAIAGIWIGSIMTFIQVVAWAFFSLALLSL